MKVNYSNGGSCRKPDFYRPSGVETKNELRNQYPSSIDPFKIPLVKTKVEHEDTYIPRIRNTRLDRNVAQMLCKAVGETMIVFKTEEEVIKLIAKCKTICPSGDFKIVELTDNGIKIKCTSV